MASCGPANPNWRGGRTITAQGYVLIRVGVAHHLADVRGYAYEHRLVGEKMVGRRLLPGEEVHHRDDSFEGRSNNDSSNLVVEPSRLAHKEEHRKHDRGLRRHGEANCVLLCACGCGASFAKFDGTGRPRRYLPGHNTAERNRAHA